ncbi:MAG: AhpC/TSA family protein [Bacteroidales bacterium]|nr:AhpC/TSA family protein [Bacteroidales bacterium]MBR6864833.1 AhpC/TSA family protein [Bacteroidales bacterium]
MKRSCILPSLLIAAAASLAMACSSTPKCTIHGAVTSQLDSVWLVDMEGNPTDSCAVQDGAFTFTTDRNTNSVVIIMPKDQSARVIVIPDAKDIQVTIGESSAAVTGSSLSEEMMALQQWIMQQFTDSNEKAMGFYAEGKSEEGAAVMEEMHKTLADHCREVYLKHLEDPIGIQAMTFLIDAVPDEEFLELYKKGGDLIRNDAGIGGYYESLTLSGNTVVQLLPDGSFTEKEGSLDDFIGQGKYVLVDFWASWCGPCKEETPFVVKAYNDYKDKGLVVLGIPVQDKMDATKKAMADLGIHYPQLLDPATKLADQYGVTAIPHLFLFGPDGQIVKDGMRGEDTDALLKTLFK